MRDVEEIRHQSYGGTGSAPGLKSCLSYAKWGTIDHNTDTQAFYFMIGCLLSGVFGPSGIRVEATGNGNLLH
jgi:hypothetical protein